MGLDSDEISTVIPGTLFQNSSGNKAAVNICLLSGYRAYSLLYII